MARSTPRGTPLSSLSPTMKLTSLQSKSRPPQLPSRCTVGHTMESDVTRWLFGPLMTLTGGEKRRYPPQLPRRWGWSNRRPWPLSFLQCRRRLWAPLLRTWVVPSVSLQTLIKSLFYTNINVKGENKLSRTYCMVLQQVWEGKNKYITKKQVGVITENLKRRYTVIMTITPFV